MRVFVGLDVSLAKTAICVVDHDGAVQWQGKVASEPGPLIKRLAEWSGLIELAGIEACPLSEWLHRGLREAGVPVVCIETRHAQRFLSSRPIKTDKNDVRGIAGEDSGSCRCFQNPTRFERFDAVSEISGIGCKK
jgi:transposase